MMDQEIIFIEVCGQYGILFNHQPIIKHRRRGFDWKELSDHDGDWELALFPTITAAEECVHSIKSKVNAYVEEYEKMLPHKNFEGNCKCIINQSDRENGNNVLIINLFCAEVSALFGLKET